MDDDGSNLVFDFEGTLEARSDSIVMGSASASDALGPAMVGVQHDQGRGSGSFRQIVCRHWLRGLCMKGESCGYLHQYDQDRLSVCHFFRAYGCCRAQDCIFKHNAEDVKECSMYNMGFCPNGPGCQYRHVKKPGPPPPVEEVVKKLQQMNSLYYGSSSGIYQPSDNNNNQQEKPPVQHGTVLKNQNLVAHATPTMQQRAAHHVQTAHPHHVPPPHIQQQQQNAQVQGVHNGSSNQATITASPLPQGQSRLLLDLVVGFGNIKSIIVRTSLQWLKGNFFVELIDQGRNHWTDSLLESDKMLCSLMKHHAICEEGAKRRIRTVAELDGFFVHGDGFGFTAKGVLAIPQEDLGLTVSGASAH